jgi:hypothetical protein
MGINNMNFSGDVVMKEKKEPIAKPHPAGG